jgi:hypothetical protein
MQLPFPRIPTSQISEVNPEIIRDLRPQALDEHGVLRVLPAAFWAQTTAQERALFGARTGIYGFPTAELVARLQDIIAGRSAIEIGAGHGVLAKALGIRATDSFQQRVPEYREWYEKQTLVTVPYGAHVEELHAARAVRRYRPQVVIACWVTHRYNRHQHERGGNVAGVDEVELLREIETYVLVGNTEVHRQKPLWSKPHEIEYPPYVFSRAQNGTRDFIAVFKGGRRA